jgi:hypothetical protein
MDNGTDIVLSTTILGICYVILIAITGIPALREAYRSKSKRRLSAVGLFVASRQKWWLLGGRTLLYISANDDGLQLTAVVPPYPFNVFVPWATIRIADGGGVIAPYVRLDFIDCSEVSLLFRDSLIQGVRRVIGGNIPEVCFS